MTGLKEHNAKNMGADQVQTNKVSSRSLEANDRLLLADSCLLLYMVDLVGLEQQPRNYDSFLYNLNL